MIHVVAIIQAKPGQRAAVLQAFNEVREQVLAEDGCIEYGACVDAAGLPASRGTFGEDTLVIIEKWESLADLQAHAKSAHMVDYGARTRELVAGKTIHILQPA